MKKLKLGKKKLIVFSIVITMMVLFFPPFAKPERSLQNLNPGFIADNVPDLTDESDDADTTPQQRAQIEKESKAAFLQAYRVFMHPRCLNCHPSGDAPLQGDDSHIHTMGVTRGEGGRGVYALKCKNCHQDTNLDGDHLPPGNPTWALPPAHLKMVFQGMSPRELAIHFKDNSFTGFIDFEKDMIHHVETESLVLQSWTHGKPPPLSHKEFVAKVKEWIAKGSAIPDK